MKQNYMVVFERVAEDNWGAWTPDVGGAVGAGESLEAARESVRAGISIMLEDLQERQLPIPGATAMSVDFSEFDPDPTKGHYEIEWLTVNVPVKTPEQVEHVQQAA